MFACLLFVVSEMRGAKTANEDDNDGNLQMTMTVIT